jgi:hypothetical protein
MLSPAQIDFNKVSPERFRGIKLNHKVNWEALSLAFDHSLDASGDKVSLLKRKRLKDALLKAVRKNGIEGLDPKLRYNYCRARLYLGDFSNYWGWEFRDMDGDGWAAHLYWEETWMPKWGGGYCDRLLVLGEQGVGDAIFAASLLPDCMVRVKEVVFECDERLHTLLTRSLPGLVVKKERQFEDRREDYGHIDAFIPSFELLRMFRTDKRAFPGLPYLRPNPVRVVELERYRGRTGVAWVGRQGSIDPMELGIEFPLSVQYKHVHRGVEQPELDPFNDLEGLVALCSVLKKVVTVPQSVHHFAGAQGVRTEIIVPNIAGEAKNLSAWDYSTMHSGGKLPWYANAQVFDSIEEWRNELRLPA